MVLNTRRLEKRRTLILLQHNLKHESLYKMCFAERFFFLYSNNQRLTALDTSVITLENSYVPAQLLGFCLVQLSKV